MKACQALIAWTGNEPHNAGDPTRGQVKVGRLLRGNEPDWTTPFDCTGGAAYTHVQQASGWEAHALLLGLYRALVVDYDISPSTVHAAFMEIDEYRRGLEAYCAVRFPGDKGEAP